jgi:hypothetical protein
MRTLFYCVVLSWLGLIAWSLFLWWQAGYDKAYTTLDTLRAKQAFGIHMLNPQALLKPWSLPRLEVNLHFLSDTPQLQACALEAIHQSVQLINLVAIATQCLLIKLVLLITAIPLFSMTALIGLVDGLNQRAIRTACLGRESSYLFHQLKRYSKKTLSLCIALWLLLPMSITPAFAFIPMSLLMGVLTAVTVSHFKKYY